MSIINWKKEEDLFPNFSSLMEDFWGKDYMKKIETGTSIPAVNVTETEAAYEVEMAAPGFKKEEFKIHLEHNLLTISSEHKEEKEEKDKKKVTRREFNYATFSRTFNVPKDVETDKIDARYTDGLLHLVLPKKAYDTSATKKPIEIK